MKKMFIVLFLAQTAFGFWGFAQEQYPVKQLTFDPAQEGFATWSPGGKYIIYSCIAPKDTTGKTGLWKISLEDGKSEQIFKGIAEHPSWSPDGRYIIFDSDYGDDIMLLPLNGRNPEKFLPDTIQIRNGGLPCWSPDGRMVAFIERSGPSVCIFNFETKLITKVFQEEGTLPLPCCWLPDGKNILVAPRDNVSRKSTLWKVSSNGETKKKLTGHHEGLYRYAAVSPDGTLLAYSAMEGKYLGLWIMLLEGNKSIPLAITRPGHNESPSWSPDGKKLAFTSTRSGSFDIWLMNMDIVKLKEELKKLE